MDGKVVGLLERNNPKNLTLPAMSDPAGDYVQLDILVHALGRVNFGCVLDMKGLLSPDVLLDGMYPQHVAMAQCQQEDADMHAQV